jgi:hypothetical protein
MPRIGSLTQSPLQPTMRRGASIVPLMRHGMTRLEPMTGQELVEGIDFTRPLNRIAHQGPGLPYLNAPQFKGTFTLAGVSRDSAGAALAFCDVRLFIADAFDQRIATTTSDGSGNYSFSVPSNADRYWVAMYKAGSPNLAGVSDRTLIAV